MINPVKEAEEIIRLETGLCNNFGFTTQEVQKLPHVFIKYLVTVLIKRQQKKKFEEMKRKNG